MTKPTGPAAGVHLPWAEVPAAVRAWAARVGGGVPRSARDLSGGFSPGATTVLDCPGGAIFVKAVGAGLNSESPVFHRREAVVSRALPSAPELPRLLDVYDDGDWVALAFVAIDGRPPAHPWDQPELQAAVRRARCPARHAHAHPRRRRAGGGRETAPALRRLGRAGGIGRTARRAGRMELPPSQSPGRARVRLARRDRRIDAPPLRRAL